MGVRHQRHPTSRSPRERRPEDQTRDAMGTTLLETRFRGVSQTLLYDEVHPHKALGYCSPREFIAAHGSP